MIRMLMATLVVALTAAPALAAEDGGGSPITGAREGLVTALTTIIIFVVLVWVLGKYAWGPIASGLKAREDKIRKDIADAEVARDNAQKTLAQYKEKLAQAEEEVRKLLLKASADGERLVTSLKMQAQQDAEEIKERATREIDTARKAATAEFKEYAATLATSIAQQILRRTISVEDQRELVDRSLEQLEAVKG